MNDHYHELDRPKERVTARVGQEVVARSERTIVLTEFVQGRALDPVYYFPREDVAVDRLDPSPTQSRCPIKGQASYWTFSGPEGVEDDLAWGYLDPVEMSRPIAGFVAFDKRRVTIGAEPIEA